MTGDDTAERLKALRWSRDGNDMAATGLYADATDAMRTYGTLRVHAEYAGIENPKTMGSESLGSTAAMEGGDEAALIHSYRFHVPLAVYHRMQQAHPDLFVTSAV